MSKVKSNLVKLFACVFAVCAAFAIATMPKANVVGAASEPSSFEVVGTSIRNGEADGLTGLRFTTKVTDAWLSENPASTYSFGTLIAPTAKLGEFDSNKTPTENMDLLDGDNIIAVQKQALSEGFEFTASIIYDEQVVIDYLAEKGSTVSADEILANLYKKSFTAIPYAMLGNEVIYADAYSESMYNTALKTVALAIENEDQDLMMLGAQYVGISGSTLQSAYVSVKDKTVVVDSVEGFQATEETALLVGGEVLVLGEDYTLDAQGNIILAGELQASATPEFVYVVDNGYIHAVDVLYANNVLKTAEDVKNFFDATTWAEDATHYNEVTVLANDVDMSTVSGDYGVSHSTTAFKGYFDGRGHVISNFTKNTSSNANPIFGNLGNNAVIKNIAFDNFSSVGYSANYGWFGYDLRGTVENIYVRFAPGSESQQMFLNTKIGHLNNVIIETPYDEELDVDAWITKNASKWGRTYLAKSVGSAGVNNMNNVHVISQLPLVLSGTTSMSEPVYTEGVVTDWENWFAYGENETKVWYDFDFFHTAKDDATAPGLGLEAGAQTVQNTQVLDENGYSMKQGKTRVWSGVKRYDTLEEMVANNPDSVSAFVNTGMWKMDNGALVWGKGDNTLPSYISGEYDASQNQLISTALNGVRVEKITVNGVALSLENEEYTVDENGYLTSIYAKTSDIDTKNGISYKINSANNDILDEVIIYTENGKFLLSDVNYYTRIIDSATELKGELERVNYTQNQGGTSGNGIVYNTYNEVQYVFNASIYKLNADIDMYDTENESYITIEYPSIVITNKDYYGYAYYDGAVSGGFTGSFDGAGHVIDNFKPTKYGMFGVLATIGSNLTTGANIKNVAFTNVLTESSKSGSTFYPVIASHMNTGETVAQNISNVYVTYSENATDMFGLVAVPSTQLYMNNVYVVNETMYNGISADKLDQYYGITLDANKQYRNIFTLDSNSNRHEYTSALFTSIRGLTNISTTYINNVLVASPNLLSYNYNFDFSAQSVVTVNHVSRTYSFDTPTDARVTCSYRNEAYYYCSNCGYYYASAECTRCGEDAVFEANKAKKTSSKSRGFAFAGNETTASIPVIKGFAPSIVADLAVKPYKDGEGNIVNTFGALGATSKPGYVCDTCDNNEISLINGRDCTAEGCEGKMNVQATVENGLTYNDYNCVWASPMAYEWTLYDLASITASEYSDSNAAVILKGVTKYDTVAEINAKADLSSFAKSDVWTIAEDGSLNWTSLYKAQA